MLVCVFYSSINPTLQSSVGQLCPEPVAHLNQLLLVSGQTGDILYCLLQFGLKEMVTEMGAELTSPHPGPYLLATPGFRPWVGCCCLKHKFSFWSCLTISHLRKRGRERERDRERDRCIWTRVVTTIPDFPWQKGKHKTDKTF